MAERILLLGGTREAVHLAQRLVARGADVTTSLAGRTREPRPVAGAVRMGGFGGTAGLVAYLRNERIDRLIDATHPFATLMSEHARAAAAATGVVLECVERPAWEAVPGDRWEAVADIEEAVVALPSGLRVLLALGSQHIAPFARRADIHFVVRMVDPPSHDLRLPDHSLVIGRPSASAEEEARMLREHEIERIVCRNSGGRGAYAKLVAARDLGLPVTMIARPSGR